MTRRNSLGLLGTILILGLSGCVRESTEGAAHTFQYELWVPLSVLVSGVIAVPAGWFLRSSAERLGWGLLIAGPLLAILIAPSLFRDRATVDDTTFSLKTGLWGMTADHEIKFDDLKQVRHISQQERGRRGSMRTKYYLIFERKDGTSAKVAVENKVADAAAPLFLKKISDRGIPIVDETGEK